MWKEAFAERRYLIITDGFDEWAGERGSKWPFRIERVDNEPLAVADMEVRG